jgi:hypothetical protein
MLDISEMVKRSIDGYASQNINTAIPCVVKNVSNLQSDQTIDVLPLIDRVYEDSVVLEPSIILNVPVVFPAGDNGLLSFPIKVGDTVLVVFSMRSIDEWLDSNGSKQTPKDRRHHHRTDAIAIPGIYTKSTNLSPHPDNVELKYKNMSVVMKPDDTLVITSNQSSITMTPTGDINISASGDVNISGTNINLN